jgi:hypothetical protein
MVSIVGRVNPVCGGRKGQWPVAERESTRKKLF